VPEVTEVLGLVEELPEVTEVLGLVKELPKVGDQPVGGELDALKRLSGLAVAAPRSRGASQTFGWASPKMPPAERILIPTIDVDSKVVHLGIKQEEGKWVWETPDHAVGHHEGTANPGEGSNVVLSGHISSPVRGEGSVFARLPEVEVSDWVFVESSLGILPYWVEETLLVKPTDIWVLYPTATETLTLITCYPDLVYSYRWVVTAKPVLLPR